MKPRAEPDPEPDARPEPEPTERRIEEAFPGRLESQAGSVDPVAGAPPREFRSGERIGDFRLLRMIGQGGMGQVWEAQQALLDDRRVALKFVRPDRVTARTLEFFQREARAGGRLSHPGIIGAYASGVVDGLGWLAMELVEGSRSVRDFIDEAARDNGLRPGYDREVARLVAEIAEAMQTAHEAGVIHRDLKPQNVLLTPGGAPKLTDFGLARITDESALSQTGEFAGTYFYMSPEQITGRRVEVDGRTDVFSLGVLLYELLALRRPFLGDTTHQVADQILSAEPPDPRTIRSRIPPELVVIAGKALEKDRARRYASMAEFAADLRRFLEHEPIRARPPGAWERAAKWVRRHPTRSLAGLAAALAIVALSTITVYLVRDLRNQSALAARGLEIGRLSGLQRLEDLIAEADDLKLMWPPYPDRIPRYEQWVADAHALVGELPQHYAKRAELRAVAVPRTEEERAVEREGHPEYARLSERAQEIERRERVLARRCGDLDDSDPESTVLPAVEPTTLMKRAELLFASGRDDEALDAGYAALEAAGEEEMPRLEEHYQLLEERVALASSAEGLAEERGEIAELQEDLDRLEATVNERRDWRFPEEFESARWWHSQLTKLISGLEELANERTGLLAEAGISADHGWSVQRRLMFARNLESLYAPGGQYEIEWRSALAKIREAYGEIDLSVQMGLVPVGPDPNTGLWEFWPVSSGERPTRHENGELRLTEDTGMILVLLPGGTFQMGAPWEPSDPNYDPSAGVNEYPVHGVELSAFFMSKFEMTRHQWEVQTGENPSTHLSMSRIGRTARVTKRNPVDTVDWYACRRTLGRMGLELSSEAQWEYGCRAGEGAPWCSGSDPRYLKNVANLADLQYARTFRSSLKIEDWNDGFALTAPVGSLAPNAFGLHDVHGNVSEWCLDGHYDDYYSEESRRDPVAPRSGNWKVVTRGGNYGTTRVGARSAVRDPRGPSGGMGEVGLRPVRAIVR